MPAVVSIGSGFFLAERRPGLTFSRVVWHAAGHEETVLDFVNGYILAQEIATARNLRLTNG